MGGILTKLFSPFLRRLKRNLHICTDFVYINKALYSIFTVVLDKGGSPSIHTKKLFDDIVQIYEFTHNGLIHEYGESIHVLCTYNTYSWNVFTIVLNSAVRPR